MPAPWKIGVLVDCLKLPLTEGMRKAAEIGAQGVQVYVTHGEMYPDNCPAPKRKEFRKLAGDLGLTLAALCGDFDWVRGFTDPEFNKVNIPRVKKCIDLAVDLGAPVVTMHIGHLPEDPAHPTYQEALRTSIELGSYAAARGVVLCSETGPERPAKLLDFLRAVGSKGIGVNYDPANLVMCGPFDHIGGVALLKDHIHHTHAKDGICLGPGKWKELPLGQGGVVFPYYLSALKAAGYTGFLTIEREGGADRVGDMARAVKFLKDLSDTELPALVK
jgi:sugar phosphate isomerase/epimerase